MDEDMEEECVLIAVKNMGDVTPNDKRFFRMLTDKVNSQHRLRTASTQKIRRATVTQIYNSLVEVGRLQSSSKKKSPAPAFPGPSRPQQRRARARPDRNLCGNRSVRRAARAAGVR